MGGTAAKSREWWSQPRWMTWWMGVLRTLANCFPVSAAQLLVNDRASQDPFNLRSDTIPYNPVYLWNVPNRCFWIIPQIPQAFVYPDPSYLKCDVCLEWLCITKLLKLIWLNFRLDSSAVCALVSNGFNNLIFKHNI